MKKQGTHNKGIYNRDEALLVMQDLCSKSEKCRKDIIDKLIPLDIEETDREWILQRLEDDNFIDEKRYAAFFVRDKFKFNHWGKIKIRHSLYLKKIPSPIIEAALNTIDEDEYFRIVKDQLIKKSSSIKETDPYKKKASLFRFGSQRGFEADLIYRVLGSND
jgi:regulatory protein